ncbi:MAG: PQQ-binding-like beta-propeller repeat protein, partial [Candidatus Brocadiae bacterium]|nr:PQQ-binding-like beta-propeller repeat protein [Candidatus Brocadiia bacterium]
MTRNWIRALLVLAFALRGAAYGADAESILKAAGVRGGLVVHLGCGDGRLTAALLASDSYVVHGLDTDPAKVAQARERIRKLGLYGKVSVDAFDGGSPPTGGELGSLPASGKLRPPASGGHLPYVDSLVNLVVASGKCQVSSEEIARVLAPRGVLLAADGSLDTRPGRRRPALTLDTRPPAGLSGWSQFTKPVPQEIDEWTHFLHGPDNNALAEDRVAGPPRHMQWLAGPQWTRHHHSDKGTNPTIRAVVSARGRLFYMVDEAGTSNMKAPSRWMLAARDGFSGVLLWKKPLQVADSARRLELVWRTLIADGDEIYAPLGPDQPLSALDAATGAAVRTYPGTAALQEAIKDGNSLLVVSQQQTLLALRADSGKRLWQWEPQAEGAIVPLTLAAADGKVFVKTDRSVVCLSADGGKRLWRTPLAGPQKKIKLRWPRERLLVRDGVVLCSYGGTDPKVLDRDKYEYLGSHPRVREYAGKLAALSADDGRVLWRSPYMPGLESMPGEIYISEGVVWLGPDFAQPRDLRTGAVKRTRAVLERLWTDGHHYRCYPGKATSRYVITAKRGIEMFDLTGEDHARNNWVRATCRVGITPCNGLIYAPPHSCGCYMEAKLSGFWALAPKGRFQVPGSGFREERLEKGSAYLAGPKPETRNPEPRSWWTYRGDVARSGSTASALPTELKPLWSAKVGGRLSSVTAADGKLFVADVDAHTVHARDARSGKALWRFAAGGRVDSPPTLVGGLALFGSRDGWVYCLRASDGALAWRFLAAPERMSAVAYEQIESLWPLHGSVLVCDGIAYVAAGRSSYVDGGIVLYGLDPATGKVRCTTRLASEHTGALDPPAEE